MWSVLSIYLWEVFEYISLQCFGLLSIYKDQFTFRIKYQIALCFDVKCIFNLSLHIKLIIFNILNHLNILMNYLGHLKKLKQMITKFT